jgi:hypothetical protein
MTGDGTITVQATITNITNITNIINQHLYDHTNMVRAHDTVHPDRSDCGGLAGCALLRAEYDTRQELTDTLTDVARRGLVVKVNLTRGET